MATEITPPPEPGYYWCNCGLIKRGGHMDIRWRHPRCTCSGDRMTIAERDGARADRDEAIQRADDAEAEIRKLMEAIHQHKRRVGAAEKETSKATARAERVVAGDLSEAAADPPVAHDDTTEAERDDVWTAIDLPARATITEYTTIAQGAAMTIDDELEIIKTERDAVNKTAEDIEARVKNLLEEANRYQKQADDAEKEAAEATLKAEEAVEIAKAEAEAEEAARAIAEAEEAARVIAEAEEAARAIAEAEEAARAIAEAEETAKAIAEAEEAARVIAEAEKAARAKAEAIKITKAVAEAAEPTNVSEGLSWDIIGNAVATGFASAVGGIFSSVRSVESAAIGKVGKAVISGVGNAEKKFDDGSQKFTASLVVTGTLLIICLVLKEK